MIILAGIFRSIGNQTFIKVGAFYLSGFLNLEYGDVWEILMNEYISTINFSILILNLTPIFVAFYFYFTAKRIQTENSKISSTRYVHFGLLVCLIPLFSTLGTFSYFLLTRLIYDYQIIGSLYAILDTINIWPILTPLLNPDSNFYLIDGAFLLILSYYLLPSDMKTKNFKKLRKTGPILLVISIPLLVVEQVGFWEAIDDPLIHHTNPFLWALYHHFLLIMILIFLISILYCGIYAIKTGYQVLEEET